METKHVCRAVALSLGLVVLALQPSPCRAADAKTKDRIEKLIQAMDDPNKPVVLSTIKKLGNYGSAGRIAVPALSARLGDRDKEVANQAARALAQIGAAAVPEVVKALAEPSPAVRTRALLTLGTMGREAGAAVVPVSELLNHKDSKVRLVAGLVLGAMHEEARPAAPRLELALRDPDPQVRLVAADALYQIGPDAIGHIVAVVKDEDVGVRLNALTTLGRFLESDKAVKTLAAALLDRSARVRAVAARSLIRLGPLAEAAVPRLLEILKEDDLEVQVQAFTALAAIGLRHDIDLGPELNRLNDEWHWSDAEFPGSLGRDPRKAARELTPLLGDGNATLRLTSALALGWIGPAAKEARPALAKLATDRDRTVRAAAALAVSTIDGRDMPDFERLDDVLKEAIELHKGALEPAALIRLHILCSAMPALRLRDKRPAPGLKESLKCSTDWVRGTIATFRFSPDDLAALIEGINLPARFNLGFTEPFTTLSLHVRKIVHLSKSPLPALYVFNNLGKDVPPDSLYWPAIQQQWLQVLARVPVDYLILEKQQSIRQQTRVLQAIEAQAAVRERTDSLTLMRDWHRKVVTFTMSGSY